MSFATLIHPINAGLDEIALLADEVIVNVWKEEDSSRFRIFNVS
jgi:hypothetical protein